MALNPKLIQGADYPFPANKGNEYTYMRVDGVKLKLFLPDRTIKDDGTVFLTSTRLVFVKNPKGRKNANFKGLELPYHLMDKPKFEQPVFGMNYITGTIRPLVDDPNAIQVPCTWNLIFSGGNCARFLTTFTHVYEESKKRKPSENIVRPMDHFMCPNSAYIDPNDPSHIYINAPVNPSVYQPQNITQNHYVPVANTNMNNPNYSGSAIPNNYSNVDTAASGNNTTVYPLGSINEQVNMSTDRQQPGGNGFVPYGPQNNMASQPYPSAGVLHGNPYGNSQYAHPPVPNYGQANYNQQGPYIYGQETKPNYNPYGNQNYGQPVYEGNNTPYNSNPHHNHNSGYNSANVPYQPQTNGDGHQQYNQMNTPWANRAYVTELTGQQNNNHNMPYRR